MMSNDAVAAGGGRSRSSKAVGSIFDLLLTKSWMWLLLEVAKTQTEAPDRSTVPNAGTFFFKLGYLLDCG